MAKRGTEPAWRKVFLTSLAATGNVTKSASVARVTRPGVYKARKENAAFAEAWDIAEEDAIQQLELEARRRAYEGFDKPVFHAGRNAGLSVNILTWSASVARVTRPGVYKARKENAAFAEAWDICGRGRHPTT